MKTIGQWTPGQTEPAGGIGNLAPKSCKVFFCMLSTVEPVRHALMLVSSPTSVKGK